MRQSWAAPVPPSHITDGAAYLSSTSLTDVSPLPPIKIGANGFDVGTEFELYAEGQFSNTGTPTLILGFYWGGVAGVALAASGAITTITGATAWPWQMAYRGTVRAIGTAGSVQGQGRLYMPASLTQFQAAYAIPATLALRTVAIDTSIEKTITVGAQWSANSASNTLTCTNISVQIIT
jgi:hypothetical protein